MNKFESLIFNSPLRTFAQEIIEIRALRKRVRIKAHKEVLEIGCGNGSGTRLLHKYFRPKKLVGIDIDPKRIAEAKTYSKEKNISYEVADVAKLPFTSESFDIVFDFSVLYHSQEWKKALVEIRRVLKPGGQFILEDLSVEGLGRDFGKMFRRLFMHTYKRPYKRQEFFAFLVSQGWHLTSKRVFSPLGFEYLIVIAAKPLKN